MQELESLVKNVFSDAHSCGFVLECFNMVSDETLQFESFGVSNGRSLHDALVRTWRILALALANGYKMQLRCH